jgi:hypothetical protein
MAAINAQHVPRTIATVTVSRPEAAKTNMARAKGDGLTTKLFSVEIVCVVSSLYGRVCAKGRAAVRKLKWSREILLALNLR